MKQSYDITATTGLNSLQKAQNVEDYIKYFENDDDFKRSIKVIKQVVESFDEDRPQECSDFVLMFLGGIYNTILDRSIKERMQKEEEAKKKKEQEDKKRELYNIVKEDLDIK